MPTEPARVAVLDDYQNLHPTYFDPLVSRGIISVDAFASTLPSFADPATPATTKDELISRLKPYSIISTMRERTPFPGELLRALPNLRLLLTTGPKNAAIDLATATELGVTVCGTTGSGRADATVEEKEESAAVGAGPSNTVQQTWALILALAKGVVADDVRVKSGGWQSAEARDMAVGLPGKTLGVIGLGRIGAVVARIAVLAFGMRVLCWSKNLTQELADQQAIACGLDVSVDGTGGRKTLQVTESLEELLKASDVVSLHYVLSDRSRGMVGRRELGAMKPTALLVNTSRGPLIDEEALIDVLAQGKIAGAALDVFGTEPLPADSPWRTTKWGEAGKAHVVLTPHVGYVEKTVMRNWYGEMAENIERWLGGGRVENVIH